MDQSGKSEPLQFFPIIAEPDADLRPQDSRIQKIGDQWCAGWTGKCLDDEFIALLERAGRAVLPGPSRRSISDQALTLNSGSDLDQLGLCITIPRHLPADSFGSYEILSSCLRRF